MNNKKILFGSLVAAAAVFVLAVFTLNFRIMQSRMTNESATATSRSGPAEEPFTMNGNTSVFVQGSSGLDKAFKQEVMRTWPNQAPYSQMEEIREAVDKANNPVVILKISEQRVSWTPFYTRATLKVEAAFASDGDVSFRNTEPAHFEMKQPNVIRLDGHYTFNDVSYGLMSLPGYNDYLAEKIAQAVLKDIQAQTKTKQG